MKFCANLSFMFAEGSTILERYSLAKEAGFRAVESAFPTGFTVDQVTEARNLAGVEQVLINISTGEELGVAAIPGKENEFRERLSETVRYAQALGTTRIHIMSGKLNGDTSPAHWQTYEENLKYAAQTLGSVGITALIEPINPHSVPGYLMNDFDKALEIIQRIGSPNLRLQLDFYHLQRLKGDLTHNVKRFLPYVGHIQIAQVPDRNEPDTPGEINYDYVFQLLEQSKYEGWIGLEYKPKSGSKEGLKWFKKYGYTL